METENEVMEQLSLFEESEQEEAETQNDNSEAILKLVQTMANEAEEEKKENDRIDDVYGKDVVGLQLPDPSNLLYYKEKRHRYLYLYDEIDEGALRLANWIIQWNLEDARANIPVEERTPIKIMFNSPGGLLDVSFTIADAIIMSKTPVIGINIGECCSGAAIIYACCPIRLTFPHSYFLLHLGSGGAVGTYQQSKAQMKDWSIKVQQMKALFIARLGLEHCENFDELIEEEWYLYADDATVEEKHRASNYNLFTKVCRDFDWEI